MHSNIHVYINMPTYFCINLHSYHPPGRYQLIIIGAAMAKPTILFILFAVFIFSMVATRTDATSSTAIDPSTLGPSREKLTHLHFFLHDIVTSTNPTAVKVAEAASTNSSSSLFGQVLVIDDPLTEGPDAGSLPMGRAQGMYAFTSQSEMSLLLMTNLVLTSGEFRGSTISFMGRDRIFDAVREMSIVGGSGVFRFASGYVEFRTHEHDPANGNAVLDVNVYVLHYY